MRKRLAALAEKCRTRLPRPISRTVKMTSLTFGVIGEHEEGDKEERRDAPCEHGDGVVALDAHDGNALRRAEREEPDDVFDALKDKEEDKTDLKEQ